MAFVATRPATAVNLITPVTQSTRRFVSSRGGVLSDAPPSVERRVSKELANCPAAVALARSRAYRFATLRSKCPRRLEALAELELDLAGRRHALFATHTRIASLWIFPLVSCFASRLRLRFARGCLLNARVSRLARVGIKGPS